MPLVIYGLGGVHTPTHIHTHTFAGESDCKKPGVRRLQAWFKNLLKFDQGHIHLIPMPILTSIDVLPPGAV